VQTLLGTDMARNSQCKLFLKPGYRSGRLASHLKSKTLSNSNERWKRTANITDFNFLLSLYNAKKNTIAGIISGALTNI